MKLRFTPRAAENIIAIADYIRERNPAAAERVRVAIYESLQDLMLFPQVGRPQQTPGVRKFTTRKYAYLCLLHGGGLHRGDHRPQREAPGSTAGARGRMNRRRAFPPAQQVV
jgi:toxin ParE1/3/4